MNQVQACMMVIDFAFCGSESSSDVYGVLFLASMSKT